MSGWGFFLLVAQEIERQEGRKPLRSEGSDTPEVLRLYEETRYCAVALWGAPRCPAKVDNVFEECSGGAQR